MTLLLTYRTGPLHGEQNLVPSTALFSVRLCRCWAMARNTRSGVAGMGVEIDDAEWGQCVHYRIRGWPAARRSCSASPQPLAPSGLCAQSVVLVSSVNGTKLSARGMQ